MDIERTRRLYADMKKEDLCQCNYCQAYVRRIKAALPGMATYLQALGVEIDKPFEVLPLFENEDDMFFTGAQYLVCGSQDGFKETCIDGVSVFTTDSHPVVDMDEEHFVIEIQAENMVRLKSFFPRQT